MGISATSDIKGQGKMVLKMTSGKELILTKVLYVHEKLDCPLLNGYVEISAIA